MDIRYLEEFLVIVEEGRLGEAADRLYTTSSSLSKHIHALEEEYGVSLFERSKRTVSLNKYGRALLPYAQEMVRLHRESGKLLTQMNEKPKTMKIISGYRIFELAFAYRKAYGISLEINEDSRYIENLRSGEYEVGFFVNQKNEDGALEMHPYTRDQLVLVCYKDHPLAQKELVDLRDLAKEDFIAFPEENPMGSIIQQACLDVGFQPNVVFVMAVGSNVVSAVKQKLGIALLWQKALVPIMMEDIAVVPLVQDVHIDVTICHIKGKKLSADAKQFIEFALQYADV